MKGCNQLTEDRFTKEELDKCASLDIKVGHFVKFRGEQCTVTSIKPITFDWENGWVDPDYCGSRYAIGYWDL